MPRNKDSVWENFLISKEKHKGRNKAKCKYCGKVYFGNAQKLKTHLKNCRQCPKSKVKNQDDSFASTSTASSCSTWTKITQKSINTFVDGMDEYEKDKINVLFARAVYSSNSPFSISENEEYLNFFQKLRPAFKPPNRRALGNSYLNREYQKIKAIALKKIEASESISLLSDSWTDINGNSITNIILTMPQPCFYTSFEMGVEGHTAQNYFEKWSTIIEEIGPQKIHAVVTDNAHNMKAALELIKGKYNHIVTYGCSAHGLNLMSKDFLKIELIESTVNRAKQIIQYFNNKNLPHQVFKNIQKERTEKAITLKIPIDTRWGTYATCLSSLMYNKEVIQAACFDKLLANIVPKDLKRLIVSEPYWERVEIVLKLLNPISTAIKNVEGDNFSISNINEVLKKMKNSILEAIDLFPNNLQNKLQDILNSRTNFISHCSHLAARFLNPMYHSNDMTNEEVQTAMDFIEEIGDLLDLDKVTLLTELAKYRLKTEWAKFSIWQTASEMSPLIWWKGFFPDKNLTIIATRLLNFPATTCSAERNFKCFSNILTKKRNRLSVDKTKKLVFNKFNYKFIADELEEADKKELEDKKRNVTTIDNSNTEGFSNIDEAMSGSSSDEEAEEEIILQDTDDDNLDEDDEVNSIIDLSPTPQMEMDNDNSKEGGIYNEDEHINQEERSDDKDKTELANITNISKTYYLQDGTKVLVLDNFNFVSKPGSSGEDGQA